MNASLRRLLVTLLVVGSCVAGGCYHIKTGGPVTPPTGSSFSPGQPTPTSSAGACQTQNTSAQIIAVSPEITATKDPTYGIIGEYGLATASGPSVPPASVIRLTSANVVQFVNISAARLDSAVGLGTSGFPPVPHSFPNGTQNPVATALGSGTWSTGRLAVATASTLCFSQTFTLPQLTGGNSVSIFMGDFDLYNTFNPSPYRGVVVVTAAAAGQTRPRAPLLVPPR